MPIHASRVYNIYVHMRPPRVYNIYVHMRPPRVYNIYVHMRPPRVYAIYVHMRPLRVYDIYVHMRPPRVLLCNAHVTTASDTSMYAHTAYSINAGAHVYMWIDAHTYTCEYRRWCICVYTCVFIDRRIRVYTIGAYTHIYYRL